mgnify:CR=1 FL=1
MTQLDVNTAMVMTARTLVEREPNYSQVTARLLLDNLRAEALSHLQVAASATHSDMATLYATALPVYIKTGIEYELLDPKLGEFDLEQLGAALDHNRDQQFGYLGLQTLYDRYFLHWNKARLELPQVFFMRVAMGLALREDDPNARAIEFYELLSSFGFPAGCAQCATWTQAGPRAHREVATALRTLVRHAGPLQSLALLDDFCEPLLGLLLVRQNPIIPDDVPV